MTSEGGLMARAGRGLMMSIIGTEDRTEPVSDRETRHLLSSHHRVTSVTTQREAALALLDKIRLKMKIKSSERDVWSGLSDTEDFRWCRLI